ncbi:MAG TPA: nucleoside-diphosphate sugar epimerase/dehydratase [Ilumatobacteraceae bacterium]|nr:nucleoside-diphosphate sugar epimerase/dehydratase [Ilumatobacteraceae bacterium]
MPAESPRSAVRVNRVIDAARRRLPLVHFAVDSSFWVVAIPLGVWLRYDYRVEQLDSDLIVPIAVAVVLQGAFGFLSGLYRRQWRYGSFDEVRVVALTAASVGVVLTVGFWWWQGVPRSVPVLASGMTLLGQIAARSVWRLRNERARRPNGDHLQRLVVVGAGEGGDQVLRTLRAASDSSYEPVALLDDDPAKRKLRLSGVRVDGTIDDLAAVAAKYHANAVLIAIPSADSSLIRRVQGLATDAKLRVLVLPPVDQLLGGVGEGDIRPVNEVDLLGRHPVDIDTAAIAGYITGKRVLVTGAGGSIGSELCRQLALFEPAKLFMLDRDESGLHGTQLSIEGRAMLDDDSLLLADIRDASRIGEIFAAVRPDVVFHAAALKHLPLLEMHPGEGWKTNVGGTLTVLEAARRHGTQRFVNVSTDKAANPTSVLGWTKRITERLTAHMGTLGAMECVSVRFGNVLGSNGSVLKAFEAQAAQGLPITVTHPDITRYFMTIAEASRLTVYAGAIGDPGEVLILDMGEPVRILDVAERFAAQHEPPLEIVFTGLRPSEKLHEDLISNDESGERRVHHLITHVTVPPLAPLPEMSRGEVPCPDEMVAIARRGADDGGQSSDEWELTTR